MKYCVLFILLPVSAEELELPREVDNFLFERRLCEHFVGEDYEGDHERGIFVKDSLSIYCAGTSDRLNALKRRYKDNKDILILLNKFKDDIAN